MQAVRGSVDEPVLSQVRAFAGWPGTQTVLCLRAADGGQDKEMEVKVSRTRVVQAAADPPQSCGSPPEGFTPVFADGRLIVRCGGSDSLEILELQPTGKKPMSSAAFLNGLKGRSVFVRICDRE